MSKLSPFAEESREQICRATFNKSTAKQLWTFSREKRFMQRRPTCQEVTYLKDASTLRPARMQFGTGHRRVFTETTDAPCSWNYQPQQPSTEKKVLFAQGRNECLASSFYPWTKLANPAPNNYHIEIQDVSLSSKQRGFSMRPKTANERTYFINNKQQKDIPPPNKYDLVGLNPGKAQCSGFGPQTRNQRFRTMQNMSPSPSAYQIQKFGINRKSRGGKMGACQRRSFIDDAKSRDPTPGPGNYKAPSDFGHYRRASHSVA